VATVYVDTSALARMLLDEPDAPAIERDLDSYDRLVASHLLQIELRRVGLRTDLLDGVSELLADVALIPFEHAILDAAETILPPTLATLDAIHLATAVNLAAAGQLDALMTYDKQLAAAAREHGIEVLSPTD
jgi:predicted nucleic acid-binding protein